MFLTSAARAILSATNSFLSLKNVGGGDIHQIPQMQILPIRDTALAPPRPQLNNQLPATLMATLK